jgi:hypothetical protein
METRQHNQRARCAGTNSPSEGQREESNHQTHFDMTLKHLHELPEDDRLRNVALKDIDVRIRCRHTKTTRDPRTWKIKGDTYNRLGDNWKMNFDFILQPTL